MRVCQAGGLTNILNDSNLIKYTINFKEIYSPEGMFRIQNDKLFKLIPEDKPIESFILDGKKLLVDKGEFKKKNIQTLPYEHVVREIEQIEYKFDSKSLVALIVLYNKNKVVDMYFTVKSNDVCNNVKNDIRAYLALLDISK